MNHKDQLQRFLFENLNIRGEVVHLDASWDAIIEDREYPLVIKKILGEMIGAAVLLSATLKFEGNLTIQVKGEGPLSFLVVECSGDLMIRALAKYDHVPEGATFSELVGKGQVVITIDPKNKKERYQGIVEIKGDSVADSLEGYMERSEQLKTRFWLAANELAIGGLLIQEMPADENNPHHDEDCWNRVEHLGSTIKSDELLELKADEIIHRLYHEEDVRIFDPERVVFHCNCSREKVSNMLKSMSQEETKQILEDQDGTIAIACEFCGHNYQFDEVDVDELYKADEHNPHSQTKH